MVEPRAEQVKGTIQKAAGTLAQLSVELDQLLSVPYASMEGNMSHSDFAKVNLNLAYTLNALYFSIPFLVC